MRVSGAYSVRARGLEGRGAAIGDDTVLDAGDGVAALRARLAECTRGGSREGVVAVEMLGQPLRCGALHEWIGGGERDGWGRGVWTPPLGVVMDAAGRLSECGVDVGRGCSPVVWIGRACWPYAMAMRPGVARSSVYVDAPDEASRVWAIDVALRGGSRIVVVADGTRFKLAQTRRLQLAAGAGGSVCLLVRARREEGELSAATTRWRVETVVGGSGPWARPRWIVTLLRHKDRPVLTEEQAAWIVEWDDAQGGVNLVAAVEGGAGEAGDGAERGGGTGRERRVAGA